ncbi:hypothetical protein [Rubrivivax albus]|uniref:Uncharacterized protein n=1 Tax=Rubrivivax albus TaxID=2499835 RepID=A0A437JNG1_9BURK|nr:hypothetical protein [Rubrivivax albus]RVT48391.1 hypothetical protein ENE75_22100 [Rubrivivax albus]
MRRDPIEATSAPAQVGPDDDEFDDDPSLQSVQRIVAASEAPPLRPPCAASVFALADVPLQRRVFGTTDRPAGQDAETKAATERCLRTGGVIRAHGLRYPADRWTAEREEQERARRARQRPPRPPRRAKTKGRKLRDLIHAGAGAGEWDE